jgi:hypothetical protein
VRELVDGRRVERREARRRARLAVLVDGVVVVAEVPLHHLPAVVAATHRVGGLPVDLLARILTHVADEQVARSEVEAEAPRVPEALRPDLVADRVAGIAGADERVVGRDRVRQRVDVDAEQLPEEQVVVLRLAVRIVAAAAVAERYPQVAVGPERDLSAVVHAAPTDERDDLLLAVRVGNVRVRGHAVARDEAARGARVGMAHEEVAVRGVVRMEGDGVEPALAAAADLVGEVQERRREEALAGDEDADQAVALDDEEPVVARVPDVGREVGGDDVLERHAGPLSRDAADQHGEQQQDRDERRVSAFRHTLPLSGDPG